MAGLVVLGTLTRAALVAVPVAALLVYSVLVARRHRTIGSGLQALGAAFLIVVVMTHLAEGMHVFPRMRWGQPDSVGHYVDLCSALLGLALTPIGFVLTRRPR